MLTLGLDAGGSATRWVLLDAARDTVVARGEAGPASGHIFDPAVRERTFAAWDAIVAAVQPHGMPARIAGGVTGLGAGAPEAVELEGRLATALGVPANRVRLGDDLWIPAKSLFPAGDGGLVYAGTGSVAYGIDGAGRTVKIGGYGVAIDDAGGAWWIATRGLRALLRQRDERRPDGLLATCLAAEIGHADWATIRAVVYGRDRGGVAALAPFVARAAAAGDPVALNILAEAGRELARLATLLAERLPCRAIAALGGAFRLHPELSRSLRATLPKSLDYTQSEVDIPQAAARLASGCIN